MKNTTRIAPTVARLLMLQNLANTEPEDYTPEQKAEAREIVEKHVSGDDINEREPI